MNSVLKEACLQAGMDRKVVDDHFKMGDAAFPDCEDDPIPDGVDVNRLRNFLANYIASGKSLRDLFTPTEQGQIDEMLSACLSQN